MRPVRRSDPACSSIVCVCHCVSSRAACAGSRTRRPRNSHAARHCRGCSAVSDCRNRLRRTATDAVRDRRGVRGARRADARARGLDPQQAAGRTDPAWACTMSRARSRLREGRQLHQARDHRLVVQSARAGAVDDVCWPPGTGAFERRLQKDVAVGGHPGFETWDSESKDAEVTVVVGNRFIVNARGRTWTASMPCGARAKSIWTLAKLRA